MKIAYTMAPGQGDTDSILFALASAIIRRGGRPAGTVQINTKREGVNRCDMDVRILPDGETIRISQALGRGSRGCRLDTDALERAVGRVGEELDRGADCLIVNKFGKHEADGRGFRQVIADAIARDVPVLIGVNQLNKREFLDFAGELARELPPDLATLEDWLSFAINADPVAA